MDDTDSGPEIHRLYYKCSKCGKSESQPYVEGYGPDPYYDCPFCGGLIIFEPNCFTCEELKDQAICDVANCIGFKFYKQRKVTP